MNKPERFRPPSVDTVLRSAGGQLRIVGGGRNGDAVEFYGARCLGTVLAVQPDGFGRLVRTAHRSTDGRTHRFDDGRQRAPDFDVFYAGIGGSTFELRPAGGR